jgi:hypothetical protein
MRFIDGEQTNPNLSDRIHEGHASEPLGSDVNQLVDSAPDLTQPFVCFGVAQGAIDERSWNSARRKLIDLIFHKRDKRRNYNRNALDHQSRQLIAERLAAAGRHDDDGVATRQNGIYDFGLAFAKVGEAEMFLKSLAGPFYVAHAEVPRA